MYFLVLILSFVALKPFETSAGRIVGGSDANIKDFPYQVAILNPPVTIGICGGSILRKRVILTVAHCVSFPRKYAIRYGSSELASGGEIISVKNIALLKKNETSSTYRDIALLFLEKDIEFGDKASTIGLPDNPLQEGTMATATGWGRLIFNGSQPRILQQILVPMISIERCKELWPLRFQPGLICAGFIGVQGKGMCNGDSGGPLVWNGKQYGIVHGGNPCALGDPDLFTDVLYFKDWIESKIKQHGYE